MTDQNEQNAEKPDSKQILKLIREMIAAEDLDSAEKALIEFEKEFEVGAEVLHLRGLLYGAREDNQKARECLEKAIDLDKNHYDAYISLAQLLESLGLFDEAASVLFKGARESNEPLVFYRVIERYSTAVRRPDFANKAIDDIKERYKNRPELDYKMGEASLTLKLHIQALEYFRRCLQKGFDGEFLYFCLARSLTYLGYVKHVPNILRKAILKKPRHIAAYEALVEHLIYQGKGFSGLLIAGARERIAALGGDIEPMVYFNYFYNNPKSIDVPIDVLCNFLGVETDDFLSPDNEGMEELDIMDAAEFKACAEVNKDLIINGHNEGLFYSPMDALAECIALLRTHNYSELAELYEGWLTIGEGNIDKAEIMFTMLNARPLEDEETKNGLKEAVAFLSNIQRPQSDSSEADALSNYGFMLDHITIKPSAVEVMGLEEIVMGMINILQQGSNRSILLSGPSGIGKTAAIHLLARRFWKKGCPDSLKNFRIFQVSTSAIVAGAKYIGEWQRHIMEVCNSGNFSKKIILYFEDIANIFGVGTTIGDSSNFADYLIPRIENGDIVIICEMNGEQASKLLTSYPKFERLLSRIDMKEPSESSLTKTLAQVADFIGEEKNLRFTHDAIAEIVELNKIFLPYRAFPGKGIDLINRAVETFSKKRAGEPIQIVVDDIILAFCEMTGIPDFIVDKKQTLDFDLTRDFFMDRVLGQEDALYSIINAVTTFKARLCDSNKPIKSFLFVGPTGVGKTESAKVLAEYLFGSNDRIIRLNMSEYSEPDCVSKLLGKEIYFDTLKPSTFIASVREQPFSIVLLDEIEKAHPLMFNLLLQLLDEGTLQDSTGRPAFFQSSIIIMTSNIGARNYTLRSIGFGDESKIDGVQEAVLSEVKEFFSPEIYNRFDEVICFKPLGMDVLEKIINREIGKVFERRGIAASGCVIDIDSFVRNHIIETGYDPKYGARHIKRAVEKSVALPLARLLASERLKGGELISISMNEGVPTAKLIEDTHPADEEFRTPTSETDSLRALKIPGKGLKNMIESLEARVISLRKKFNYEAACQQKENLQQMMNQPDFWDDPRQANNIIKKIADLNKKTERIRKWDSLFDKIKATAQLSDERLSKPEIYQTKSQLFALLKELESAELEVLLEGQHDYSDAFLILAAAENNEENIRWLLEITGVYIKWAKRRGFIYRLFGEDSGNGMGRATIFMHIGGLNAYGLLKNESGIHKKIFLRQPPRGPQVIMYTPNSEYDCNVLILPDIEYPKDEDDIFKTELTKLRTPVPGMKMRSLHYKINLKCKNDGVSLQFCSDSTVQNDKNIAADLFRAYLENLRERGPSGQETKSERPGALVRTFETGDRNRIIDHRSKMIIQNPKDYLNGKIDSLLLERIL